jgi:hypothetical protein
MVCVGCCCALLLGACRVFVRMSPMFLSPLPATSVTTGHSPWVCVREDVCGVLRPAHRHFRWSPWSRAPPSFRCRTCTSLWWIHWARRCRSLRGSAAPCSTGVLWCPVVSRTAALPVACLLFRRTGVMRMTPLLLQRRHLSSMSAGRRASSVDGGFDSINEYSPLVQALLPSTSASGGASSSIQTPSQPRRYMKLAMCTPLSVSAVSVSPASLSQQSLHASCAVSLPQTALPRARDSSRGMSPRR